MFSNGSPMLLGGDEFGRTQHGNNNAYCQDNEISWLDWKQAETPAGRAFHEFTRRCIAVRMARPTLHSARFFTQEASVVPDVMDVTWLDESGNDMMPENWEFLEGRLLGLRRVAPLTDGRVAGVPAAVSLLLMNASHEDREFTLPQPIMDWRVVLDGAHPLGGEGGTDADGASAPAGNHPNDNKVIVAAHSAMLLTAEYVDS
jgi:isoamylase